MDPTIKEYYSCMTCNLTFKNLKEAVEHKINSCHIVLPTHFPLQHHLAFPPIELKIPEGSFQEFSSSKPFQIGEPVDPPTTKEHYVCLTCNLTFKRRQEAEEHSINSRHKVVRENYPIGPSVPTTFGKIEDVVGENIDYNAFNQRMLEEMPESD